jgi:hypothetical protein
MSFFGVQFALILVAFEHILFINLTNIEYPLLGRRGTKIMSWVYLGLFVPNTIFQIVFAGSIFWTDHPILDVAGPTPNPTHILIIFVVDRMWLFLVGVMPLLFAQVGRKTQAYVKITLELDSEAWNQEPVVQGREGGDEQLFEEPEGVVT